MAHRGGQRGNVLAAVRLTPQLLDAGPVPEQLNPRQMKAAGHQQHIIGELPPLPLHEGKGVVDILPGVPGLVLFSVLDGWWYEGYRFDEQAGWALTDKRTYTDQSQQDKLDAATIYSMLENEIIPLYFAKNSKGYSPEWVQYIKRSIGHIAPHFTMKRMIDDYIERFYDPEAKRFKALSAHDYALAKEIVTWKNKVVDAWDGIQVLDMECEGPKMSATGNNYSVTVKVDTNGLGRDLGLEYVAYRMEDGVEKLHSVVPFKVEKEDGSVLTYRLDQRISDAGVYRYAFRLYPINPNLPHRQDFAYVRWI